MDRPWRIGAAYGFVSTRLKLTTSAGTQDADFTKHAVTLSLDRRVADRWTVSALVGATLAGSLDAYGRQFDLSPGPLGTFAVSFRAVDERQVVPFLLFTGSLGASVAWTRPGDEAMVAFDGRIGVAAGKTIAHVVTPYVLARAFGLPIFWNALGASVVANDAYHYQLGAGLVVRAGTFDVLAEGAVLGERALVVGAGAAF